MTRLTILLKSFKNWDRDQTLILLWLKLWICQSLTGPSSRDAGASEKVNRPSHYDLASKDDNFYHLQKQFRILQASSKIYHEKETLAQVGMFWELSWLRCQKMVFLQTALVCSCEQFWTNEQFALTWAFEIISVSRLERWFGILLHKSTI